MNICVGGELDGQKIEKEGRLLKASDIDPSFKTEYYKQVFNRDNINYHFGCQLDLTYMICLRKF